ncbi:DNA methyltransferase [Bosea sp. 62]|uniref:DNA cytosine methyltransferase n=1 Tax=unclassified Bosea (in: a-proteobacteria) TaxID=2653178 RepID=UPI0012586766|nr:MULTISPECIES: DNA cytosine methyltransferase [unclassified Bosea (in: a-proteobacteria)]CAD5255891.1 DNA methyltransferase [Bosea sp. 7B]CAD5274837.1 DNA methyltransferase [Bosea sp. 21B]CAD5275995.1 DNA methyltransferase [Bosea sp. 46]VVT60057.1 C-5 cytosine-specific DNA methylase [Bosea sp. EC-HK365B]VXB53402.1 DNA methyltransferase [Bosea sp. 62]
MRELIVDSFAGGGGASTGIEMALGRSPDIAVNHDRIALAMHRANHPNTRHMLQDVATVDAVGMCQGQPIGFLWMSPDCTDHSKAKGAAPRRDGETTTRGIGWAIYGWIKALPKWQRPRVIGLENVEEYVDWGPLLPNGKRCPKRKGETFKAFVEAWRALGYIVEWRERRAWWSGSGTIRKRLYVMMRRDGEPIVWPPARFGNPNLPADAVRIAAGELKPWVTIAECIDWSRPIPSIFDSAAQIKAKLGLTAKRPLAPKTMARVAKGVERYVLKAAKPFVIKVNHTGRDEARDRDLDVPLTALTGKRDDALVTPFVTKFRTGAVGHRADEPVHTITAHSSETHGGGAAPLGIVAPFVAYAQQGGGLRPSEAPIQTITASPKDQNTVVAPYLVPRYGERPGQEPRTASADQPGPTIVPDANEGSVAVVHLTRQFGNSVGSGADEPVGTITAGGDGKAGVVAAFIAQHNTGLIGHDVEKPVSTIVNKGCTQGLVAASMVSLRGSDRRDASADSPGLTDSSGGQHNAVVSLPMMTVYYGSEKDAAQADAPLRTDTVRDRFGLLNATAMAPPFGPEHQERARVVAAFLREHGCWDEREFVTVDLDDATFVLVDICMRMLTPRERYTANGFPPDYIIDHGINADGSVIEFTLEQQGHMCGNAVCPTEARDLVAANYQPRERKRPGRPAAPLPFFMEAAE